MSTPNLTALEQILQSIDLRLRLLELKMAFLAQDITSDEFIAQGVALYDEIRATPAAQKAAVEKSKSVV